MPKDGMVETEITVPTGTGMAETGMAAIVIMATGMVAA